MLLLPHTARVPIQYVWLGKFRLNWLSEIFFHDISILRPTLPPPLSPIYSWILQHRAVRILPQTNSFNHGLFLCWGVYCFLHSWFTNPFNWNCFRRTSTFILHNNKLEGFFLFVTLIFYMYYFLLLPYNVYIFWLQLRSFLLLILICTIYCNLASN